MRYVRFTHLGHPTYGVVEGEMVIPITTTPFEKFGKVNNPLPLSSVELLSPCVPSKAVCIGLNYRDHAEEVGIAIPTSPVVFLKPSSAVIGPHRTIVLPAMSQRVDYEAELAIVIGKVTSHIAKSEVPEHILGYTCANDVTARDLQPKDGQWTISKGFDTFLPLGPMITDEIDPTNIAIQSRLNGVVRQSSNTSNLIFDCTHLVSYLSHIMTLYPGDVILTGTPSGIGVMANGDTIAIELEGIGILSNPVADEKEKIHTSNN